MPLWEFIDAELFEFDEQRGALEREVLAVEQRQEVREVERREDGSDVHTCANLVPAATPMPAGSKRKSFSRLSSRFKLMPTRAATFKSSVTTIL